MCRPRIIQNSKEKYVSVETDKLGNCSPFMNLKCSLLCSQQPAANVFPEQLTPAHNLAPCFFMGHFIPWPF